MGRAIEFTLNHRQVQVVDFTPNLTLLEYLRRAGLTGSKEGCAEGDCGACSVAIITNDSAGRPCYRAVNSCLVPLCLLSGRQVLTVEGVAKNGGLHPVQKKMVECHGSQCGYCTPGFILSLLEGYYREPMRSPDALDDQLCGNLCRCTGYLSIRQAAVEAFAEKNKKDGKDFLAEQLKKADVSAPEVHYEFAGESFFRPTSLAGLLQLRKKLPAAHLIAGATELGLDITKRFKRFPTLISLVAVP